MKTTIPAAKIQQIKDRYSIGPARSEDRLVWLEMWKDYAGDSGPPEQDILERTWQELLKADGAFKGLFLYDKETGSLAGFLHYILHPSTWHKGWHCYVEDGYIAPDYRPKGAMAALYDALIERADLEKWEQLYWMTRADNLPARRFYDRIAESTNWVRYEYKGEKHESP